MSFLPSLWRSATASFLHKLRVSPHSLHHLRCFSAATTAAGGKKEGYDLSKLDMESSSDEDNSGVANDSGSSVVQETLAPFEFPNMMEQGGPLDLTAPARMETEAEHQERLSALAAVLKEREEVRRGQQWHVPPKDRELLQYEQHHFAMLQAMRDRDIDRMFDVFAEVRAALQLPDFLAYYILLDGAAKSGDVHALEAALSYFEEDNVALDVHYTNLIIKGYILAGQPKAAREFYKTMLQLEGFQPNLLTFTLFIGNAVKNNDLPEAFEWFNYMRRRQVSPDEYVFRIMIDHCLEKGDVENMVYIWNTLKRMKFCMTNQFQLSRMVELFAEKGETEDFESVIREMRKTKVQKRYLAPDAEALVAVFNRYAADAEYKKALGIVDTLERVGSFKRGEVSKKDIQEAVASFPPEILEALARERASTQDE